MTMNSSSPSISVVSLLSCMGAAIVLLFLYFVSKTQPALLGFVVMALPFAVALLLWDTRWKTGAMGIAFGTGLSYAIPMFFLSGLALIFGSATKDLFDMCCIFVFTFLVIATVALSIRVADRNAPAFLMGTAVAIAYVVGTAAIVYGKWTNSSPYR